MSPLPADSRRRLATPLARIGVIIPTSNRLIEPQFQHYAPHELGIHFAQARITGRWARPIADLAPEIARAASALADTTPDLIMFNCTGTSMQEGPEGDEYVLEAIRRETGIAALSTAQAVVEALNVLGVRKFVLVTPYVQATNAHEIAFLRALNFEVLHDVALGLKGGDQFIAVQPERWTEIALAADRAESDGYFLSCTNTTQIETIEVIEAKTGVSSNQAVLWALTNRLRRDVPSLGPASAPGRLNAHASPAV